MIEAVIALLLASSGAVDCKALDARATQEGARIAGDEAVYEVIGTGRAPFYSAPNLACPMRGVFIIPKDQVTAYVDYGDFTSVMFLNLKTGTDTEGWVQTSRLRPTGTGISPPEPVTGSAPVAGDWCAHEEGASSFEEFSLEQQGDERFFSSFLHARPEYNGTWSLQGRKLSIDVGQGVSFEFKVLSVSDKELELLSDDGATEHYFKDGCASATDPDRPGGSATTRFGVVDWISSEESGRATISVDGAKLRSFRADEVELTTLDNPPPGLEYVLVHMWKGALNCHNSFAVVELRKAGKPRISEEFGECTDLDMARVERSGVSIDLTETVGSEEVRFRYIDGKLWKAAR